MERYNIRHIARVVVEATTPIAVGSGEKDIMTDARVIKDVNGLPYIPATSVAGVLRHAMGESDEDNKSEMWGYQMKKEGAGSRIIFTNANIVDADGTVVDGLMEKKSSFLQQFDTLPIRQHARIGHKGTTEKGGKFDEEVVYKGTRFCFEIEMVDKEGAKGRDYFICLLKTIRSKNLRMGGGTRSGFGELKVVNSKERTLVLSNSSELEAYINKSSSLADDSFWKGCDEFNDESTNANFIDDMLILTPEDFFLFGSGMGDEDADMTPVSESFIKWENDKKGVFLDNNVLIPGASVKGALAHRVAFHYNKLTGVFADNLESKDFDKHIGKENDAVRILFGSEGDKKGNGASCGNVFISDVIQQKHNEKILNHVAIDRFTGGAIDGALFNEKVSDERGQKFELKVSVDTAGVKKALTSDAEAAKEIKATLIYQALENALDDICNGMLPLGGGVNRGNGVFEGDRNHGCFLPI